MEPRIEDEIEHLRAYRWQPYTAAEIEAIERAMPEARRLKAEREARGELPPWAARTDEERAEGERIRHELKLARVDRDTRRDPQG